MSTTQSIKYYNNCILIKLKMSILLPVSMHKIILIKYINYIISIVLELNNRYLYFYLILIIKLDNYPLLEIIPYINHK
jgi:hypothetical protein